MAYYCTRCEAEEHPDFTVSEVRNDVTRIENYSVTAWCDKCNSNTYHLFGQTPE